MLDRHFSKLTQFKTFFLLIISQRSQGEQAARLRTWPRWRGVGVSLVQGPVSVLLVEGDCMMMAQLRTPGYKVQVARPGGPEPSHCLVILAWPLVDTGPGHSRGRLQTAPADDRQLATGRNYNYTQKKLQIMGKSNLWRARPNPAASAELVVPLRKANGPIFQDFCQGTEQRSLGSTRLLLMLSWCWNSTFSPSKYFCANLNYVTFFPVFSAVPWCFLLV